MLRCRLVPGSTAYVCGPRFQIALSHALACAHDVHSGRSGSGTERDVSKEAAQGQGQPIVMAHSVVISRALKSIQTRPSSSDAEMEMPCLSLADGAMHALLRVSACFRRYLRSGGQASTTGHGRSAPYRPVDTSCDECPAAEGLSQGIRGACRLRLLAGVPRSLVAGTLWRRLYDEASLRGPIWSPLAVLNHPATRARMPSSCV